MVRSLQRRLYFLLIKCLEQLFQSENCLGLWLLYNRLSAPAVVLWASPRAHKINYRLNESK